MLPPPSSCRPSYLLTMSNYTALQLSGLATCFLGGLVAKSKIPVIAPFIIVVLYNINIICFDYLNLNKEMMK